MYVYYIMLDDCCQNITLIQFNQLPGIRIINKFNHIHHPFRITLLFQIDQIGQQTLSFY